MSQHGEKYDYSKDPPWWLRFLIGVAGSSVAIASPIALRLENTNINIDAEFRVFIIGTGLLFAGAWFLSVLITGFTREDSLWKCVLTSLGIPGIVISLTLSTQLIK